MGTRAFVDHGLYVNDRKKGRWTVRNESGNVIGQATSFNDQAHANPI